VTIMLSLHALSMHAQFLPAGGIEIVLPVLLRRGSRGLAPAMRLGHTRPRRGEEVPEAETRAGRCSCDDDGRAR
jgi:hypothetical protein